MSRRRVPSEGTVTVAFPAAVGRERHAMARFEDDPLIAGLVELGDQLPFNRHLGVEVVALEAGRCTTRLRADDRLANHLGGVHAIAELAPVELAGAMAASTRLRGLLERGYVPVVRDLSARYEAAATGELTATATVPEGVEEAVEEALAAGYRPRAIADVEVTDAQGTLVATAQLTFVYLEVAGNDPS